MSKKRLEPYDLVECLRCGKTEFAGNADNWNAVFDAGVIVAFLCPDCQTDEENIEAQVNEATIDYSKMKIVSTLDELMELLRPRFDEALETIAAGDTERGNAMFRDCLERFRKAWNAGNRHNLDMQLYSVEDAYAVLVRLGELPEL